MVSYEHTNTGPKRQLTHVGAALALAVSVAACGSQEAPDPCESPRVSSALFPADPVATADRETWTKGIAIRTQVPASAEGVVVGYRGRNAGTWKDSSPVAPDRAQVIAVLLGNGPVAFSVFITAAEGSAACTDVPVATFNGPQPIQPLIAADAALPQW